MHGTPQIQKKVETAKRKEMSKEQNPCEIDAQNSQICQLKFEIDCIDMVKAPGI